MQLDITDTDIAAELGDDDDARQEQSGAMRLMELMQYPNVAEALDEQELAKIGAAVVRMYDLDDVSRDKWKTRAKRAMDLATQEKQQKTFPWDGASNVKYPMLTTAALQFAARAYPAIVDGPRVVKCQVLGQDDEAGSKAAAAGRVSQHMSHQLLNELPDWESDIDTALHQLPITGCVFRKVYADPSSEAGFKSDLVSAFDLVVNTNARSLETVPRITHRLEFYPHEFKERQRAGTWIDTDLESASNNASEDEDAPHEFLEQHCYLDLDGDGAKEPWIVTVHKDSEKVVRIKPCFDPQDVRLDEMGNVVSIKRKRYFVLVPFIPSPDGGFYPVGFGHLLDSLSDVIDATINQMMDAGTLQNAGGGFIGAGVSLGKGKSEIKLRPGQYKTIQSTGDNLRNQIVAMEHPGPSKVLFELLSLMIDAGKDIAAIQDILVGDMPRNQTATTTMAMIEQGLKVFTAIYKRIYRALSQEYRLIFEINKTSLNVPRYVALIDGQVSPKDYMGDMDIMPVADPNTITDMQRMAKAQIILDEFKGGNPHVDGMEATKRAFEAARIERLDALLTPPPEGPSPQDEMEMENARVEIDAKMANIQKTMTEREMMIVEMDKLAAEAQLARAQIGAMATGALPAAKPDIEEDGAPVEFDRGEMMDDTTDAPAVDPAMMAGGGEAANLLPEPEEPPMQPPPDMVEGIPDELAMQIAAEQEAAGDALPGDIPTQ